MGFPIAIAVALVAAAVAAGGYVGGVISSHGAVADAQRATELRVLDANRSELELVQTTFADPYVEVTLRNSGPVPLRGFADWDLWAMYTEADGTYHAARFTYTTANPPAVNQWTLLGIYVDASTAQAESHQPGIFDPMEEMVIRLQLSATPSSAYTNLIGVGTSNAATATVTYMWRVLGDTPANAVRGGALTHDGTDVYALRGASNDFWRYEVDTGLWSALADTPNNVREGAALAFVEVGSSPYIYAFRGDNRRDFWRYSIDGATWEDLGNAPNTVDQGGAMAWNGIDTLYALRGDNNRSFWAYDAPSNNWDSLPSVPSNVNGGGALAYLDRVVYALRGGGTTDFWQYDVDTGAWTVLAATPAAVNDGGALATDGEAIYALRGANQNDVWRYDVADDTWSAVMSAPGTIDWGGAITRLDGRLYVLRGHNANDFWSYQLPTYTP